MPVHSNKAPVATLTLAAAGHAAFAHEDTALLLAALVAPHARGLAYETRRGEMSRLVQHVLMPLAAELSVRQGRFKRVQNACGEALLCLDETRGLRAGPFVATDGGGVRARTASLPVPRSRT